MIEKNKRMHAWETHFFSFQVMITIVQDPAHPRKAALDERALSPVEIFLWLIRTNQIHGNFKDRLLQFIESSNITCIDNKKKHYPYKSD